MKEKELLQTIFTEIEQELKRANNKYGDTFHSRHEGYAVLKKEVDELWMEIKERHVSLGVIRDEATQVAAMAVKLILSCCSEVE